MNNIFLILLLTTAMISGIYIEKGMSRGKVEKVHITEKVKTFFGEEILTILSDPDSVLSYKVKPVTKKNKTAKDKLYKYPIVKRGPKLDKDQILYLKNIILNEKTYDFKYSKRGFLFPEYAFEFIKGEKKVLVFVCFNRNELMFYYKKKELIEDFDSALKEVKELVHKLFK